MMGSTLPPADTNTVFAILRLLADPKAAEAKLKDLVEADTENALKLQTLAEQEVSLKRREDALVAAAAELVGKQKAFDVRDEAVTKRVVEASAANELLVKKLGEKQDDLEARERSLQARTEACNTREAQFDEIDRRLKQREEQLVKDQAYVAAKIQEIRRLAG